MSEDIETKHAATEETTVCSEQRKSLSWKTVALSGVKGAALGVMLILGMLGICAVMQFEGGDGFAGWIGLQGHQLLAKPGMSRLIEDHGADAVYNVPGYVKSKYVLVPLIRIGLLMGALAGVIVGFMRRDASNEDQESISSLPAAFPLGVALVGLFWHGFVWGNAAIFCLPATRKRTMWLTGATWVVAFLAVFLWAWGLETTWEDGWSTQIPPHIKNFIYWIGSLLGLKE